MSEISGFAVALALPVLAGIFLAKLVKSIGTIEVLPDKKYHWPTTIERGELLGNMYHKELIGFNEQKLNLLKNNTLNIFEQQHNHLEAMMRSINAVDIMSVVANEKHQDLYAMAHDNLGKIRNIIQKNEQSNNDFELIKTTDTLLRKLTLSAHSTLADIERDTTSDLVKETLQSMGYKLKTKGGNILGVSRETSIRATVSSEGHVLLDTKSFKGISCQKEVARFENTLKENGIVLRRLLTVPTKRRDGVLLKDPFPPLKIEQDIVADNKEMNQTPGHKSTNQNQNNFLRNQSLQRQRQKLKGV